MNDPKSLGIENLPASIADKLSGVSQRIRRILFLRGLFTVLSISLVTLLGVMVIDAATLLFSSGIRWLLSLTAFTVIAFSIFWYLVRPLKRKRSLSEIARILETRNKDLSDERISSTVEILSRQYSQGEAFSPVLLKQLVADAEKDAEVILPQQLFTLKSAKRMIISLGIIGFVYLLIFGIWPGSSARLFVRAVAPFAEVGSAMADRLKIQPGDVRVAVGDPLTIEVGLEKAPSRDVELRTQWAGQPEMVETMQSTNSEAKSKVFRTGFPRVNEDFEYRIRSGHALSRFYKVRVFSRPEISNVTLQVTPPAYTGLESYTETFTPGRVEVLAGSEVQFGIQSQTVLESAELILDSESLGAGKVSSSSGERSLMHWTIPTQGPARSFDWRVKLKSRDGFENKPVRNHVFAIVGDEVPELERIQPVSQKVELPPDGFITLEYQLRDDYGISRCELHISVDGGEKEIVLDAKAGKKINDAWPVKIPLYLQSLNIDGARSLDVQLVVYDNLPENLNGPQKVESEGFKILLEQGQENFVHQQVKQQHELAIAGLENIIRELEKLSRDAHEIQNRLEKGGGTEAMAKAGEVRAGLESTEQEVRALVAELENGVFDIIAVGLEQVADNEIQRARRLGETMPLADELSEQKTLSANLKSTIDDALRKVKGLAALNDAMADDALRLAEIEELTRQQDDLVEQANDANWQENIEEWQAQQQALAEELAALTEADQKLQEFAENTQNAAENMQDAAHDAQEAVALAENVDLPEWMIAQDKALQAQLEVLKAQALALKAQDLAVKTDLSGMAAHQQRAERSQAEAEMGQLAVEKAQAEALTLLKNGGPADAVVAQEQANQLQNEAKMVQVQADADQGNAREIREGESGKEAPDVPGVKASQNNAEKVQQRAYVAQEKAFAQQKVAMELSTPDLDQAIMDAVEQQKAAEAAQQEALEAQQQAEDALKASQDESLTEEEAAQAQSTAENAQAEAEKAQQAASEAQQAAAEAQSAAQNAAETPEQAEAQARAAQAQQEAQAAQEAANEAQETAQEAAEQARQTGTAEDQAAAERAQQAATEAQEQAASAQEAASEAQPQTAATESRTAARESAQAAEAAAAAATQAADAAREAGLPEEADSLNDLAEEAQATADALSDAAEQPGLPSNNGTMAESAEQMAEIAQALAEMTPPAPNETATAAMEDAASQAAQAAQSTSQDQAAAQAAATARALQQASQSVAREMGMEAPPSESTAQSSTSESTKGGKDTNGPNDERVPEWVSDIGLTRADWVRMRTLSDPDGASIDDAGIPREYRQLVRDYFMELNKEQKDRP